MEHAAFTTQGNQPTQGVAYIVSPIGLVVIETAEAPKPAPDRSYAFIMAAIPHTSRLVTTWN